MRDTLLRSAHGAPGGASALAATPEHGVTAGWREGLSIVNLRGPADDASFVEAVSQALGVPLPLLPCTSQATPVLRVVWVGPDDWFVIGAKGQAGELVQRLRRVLEGQHHAVTDVSSNYTVLHMSGPAARDVLAQGCPLDLHPRVFKVGASAGSLFFRASIWIWQADDAPTYEVLVRRSFMGYVWLMVERCTLECGLLVRHSP